MIHSFHFSCEETHLSLFCSLGSITIHRVCPACCLDPGPTILRMCNARMGILIARQFFALCTTWSVSEFLDIVMRNCRVPWHWAFFVRYKWWFIPTQYWTWNSGNTTLKTPEGAHGEPLIASKSSNVVTSGITFTVLDLITRPSPFRATMCSSGNVFPATCPGATSPS